MTTPLKGSPTTSMPASNPASVASPLASNTRVLVKTTLDFYALIDPDTNQRSGRMGVRLKQGTQIIYLPEDCPIKLVAAVEYGQPGSAQMIGTFRIFYTGPMDPDTGEVPAHLVDFDNRDIHSVSWTGYERATLTPACFMAMADSGLPIELIGPPEPEPVPEEPEPDPEAAPEGDIQQAWIPSQEAL